MVTITLYDYHTDFDGIGSCSNLECKKEPLILSIYKRCLYAVELLQSLSASLFCLIRLCLFVCLFV